MKYTIPIYTFRKFSHIFKNARSEADGENDGWERENKIDCRRHENLSGFLLQWNYENQAN